ncbi:hypothetical protein BRC91_09530 [Halobacteriales archaeon QS_4_62_28]|nr:MAG: hypothetical protein BRC91_09530 [Halobacteriales archaeon QS_4_62_28]
MLLHEADGKIEGAAKFNKLLYKHESEEDIETEITQIRDQRGPREPGLSQTMQRYIDLGLIKVDKSEEPHTVEETKKGNRYMSGWERTKMRFDRSFREKKRAVSNTIRKHGDRSANEIVQDDDIQEEKEKPVGKNL